MALPQFNRPRGALPSLARISREWDALGPYGLRAIFPDLRCYAIGWGEPFCFRCGWLAPSKEAADYPRKWPAEKAIDAAWEAAQGWLERCHLHDHLFGGSVEPLNIVPMCVLCHEEQPNCRSRAEGIAFVNSPCRRQSYMWAMQMATDEMGRGRRRPGKAGAMRTMLRAQATVAQFLSERSGGST